MFFPPYANELNEYRHAIVDGFIANYKNTVIKKLNLAGNLKRR